MRHRPDPAAPTAVERAAARVGGQCVLVLALFGGLLFALWKERFLPGKYFADSEYIRGLLQVAEPSHSDPFFRTARLYHDLGLTDPGTVAVVSYLLFCVALLGCLPFRRAARLNVPWGAMVAFCVLSGAIYLAQFSKELLVLGIVALVALSPRGRAWTLVQLAALCAYASWMRPYWWLTAAAYAALLLVLPRVRTLVPLVLPVVVGYLGLAVTTVAVEGKDLTGYRTLVNDGRIFTTDAASRITEVLPGSGPLVATGNVLIDLVGLVVPFPLLRHGNVVYLGFGAVICWLWVSMLCRAQRAARTGALQPHTRLTRAVALLVAVVCVQAVFEPDYGSYLKHLSPFLPLFLLVVDATSPADEPSAVPAAEGATERSLAGG